MFMKKMYISPAVEIFATLLNQEVLAGHSGEWGDAKGISFDDSEENENDDTEIKNLWDE